MAKQTTLTDARLRSITLPAKGDAWHADKAYPGLALRVQYGGSKTWFYRYRAADPTDRSKIKQRRYRLGSYPAMSLADARTAWRDARAIVDEGGDPQAAKMVEQQAALTFDAMAQRWLDLDQADNKSRPEVERKLRVNVLSQWTGREAASISKADVASLLDSLREDGKDTTARRVYSMLNRLFRWAEGRDYVAVNPVRGLERGSDVKRDRVLSDDEVARVWQAAKQRPYPFGPMYRLLMLTGQRLREVGDAQWSEIGEDGRALVLESARTKNGEPHTVRLSPLARRIVRDLPRAGDYLFTTTGSTPSSGYDKAKRALDALTAITAPDGIKMDTAVPLEHWLNHDLRRTTATGMQRLGIPGEVIEAVQNRISGSKAGVAGIYQRDKLPRECRKALDAWARYVALLGSPRVWAKVREHIQAHDVPDVDRDDVRDDREDEMFALCRAGGDAWFPYLRKVARPATADYRD